VRSSWHAAAAALAILVAVGTGGAHDPDDSPLPAPMEFVPPSPGSYVLHAIMRAPEGRVLDLDGRPYPMSRFTSGKITLLGFIYTSCADPRGCPLTAQVFHTVRHRVSQDSDLRARVRLVSLSFDPVRDTPAVMRHYAAEVPDNGVEWAFLTTERPRTLVPLLDGFGQDVRVELDAHGRRAGPLAHVLKVFLIDTRGVVREIYTTSYLYPEVILNDIKTLRLEDRTARRTDP
jgi:cytochrome oxidase Cu insertion factor (SCO1/SenC/PrrC family)